MPNAYIIDTTRTPRAKRKGKYSGIHPIDLLTFPLTAITNRNKIDPTLIEDVAIGCVTQTSEQAWCIARKAILAANWPISIPGTTVNRLCGSGLQACNFIADAILAGNHSLAIAGGVEHMTRVPMFSDAGGEESPLVKRHHPNLVDQGSACELLAKQFKITREQSDSYASKSQKLAAAAREANYFDSSLIPVDYVDESGAKATLNQDDNIRPGTTTEKLAQLDPVFKTDGMLTAGNSSAIVDGAAAVLLASEQAVKDHKLDPRARIVASSVIGSDPLVMLSGPIAASRLALKKAGRQIADIDLWEINEAFAPVPLATINELKLDPELVNVNGGAIALGHPLGATGAILLGTALDELERRKKKLAVVTMCIGLGMGIATIIERL